MVSYSSLLVVLVLSVVAAVTDGQSPCCCPAKLTVDAVICGNVKFRAYIDWTINKAYEDWGGKDGISYKLYDGKDMTYYVRKTSGDCKKYTMSDTVYNQCVPSGAVHVKIPAESGCTLDGWSYNPNSHTARLVVVKRNGCLPYRIEQSNNDKYEVAHFVNIVQSVADSSVFQTDVSDCVAAAVDG